MARIALIDDDPDFTYLMRSFLESCGWQVVVCDEERDAVRCVREEKPDVIVLDVRMQTAQAGWTILQELRANAETRRIPVIVCSAARDAVRRREAWLAEEGVAVLHKPFDLDDLVTLIERYRGDDPSQHCTDPPDTNGKSLHT